LAGFSVVSTCPVLKERTVSQKGKDPIHAGESKNDRDERKPSRADKKQDWDTRLEIGQSMDSGDGD